jgi:hypothetical protein
MHWVVKKCSGLFLIRILIDWLFLIQTAEVFQEYRDVYRL